MSSRITIQDRKAAQVPIQIHRILGDNVIVQEGLEENRLTWRQARAMVANTETLRSCAGNYQIFPIRSLSSGARALHSVNASELSEKFAPTA